MDLNDDECKAVDLLNGDESLASFAATCGSDDLEERLADEAGSDIDIDQIDFVKVLHYFQNT